MIVRILGEGQFDIADRYLDELNALDDRLQAAVETGDAETFAATLQALLEAVRRLGTALPADVLAASQLVLPDEDTTLEQVRSLLAEEGLIPG
ncbi:PspA-associated protein PspAA [Streptosporangium sp. CA-135522]|uniref:PspA-associated protein PspAA n=1 Tax=Streptosporangium sp. CA-135522 TaxID=3240072 RepID=UPI003D93FCF4